MIYEDISETIGRTPVVRINRLAPAHVTAYVKLEAANPGGSVKDRLALGIIEDAERRGLLKPGATIVEATSGNTGIALALVCAARGYRFVAVMPESFSVERRQIMRAYGAKVILTPAAERASGAVLLAERLSKERGWFLARQFDNEANPAYHRQTTGPEILADFAGRRLDYWVTGYGTGGTLTGVGRVLRRERPETKIILCEPTIAALLGSGTPQERREDRSPAGSHPAFTPHPIQGWTPDFIPYVLQESVDQRYYDELIAVAGPDAIAWSRRLAAEEGILTGISGGATLGAAVQVAERAPEGAVVYCMLPDTGERYLSTPLFEGVETEMTPEEIALSRSTPGYQMGGA